MVYVSILLAVGGNVLYHVAQKSVPRGINPAFSVTVSYVVALALSAALLPLVSDQPLSDSVRELNWASFGVGVAIVAVEFGFLLAYRAGWNLSTAWLVVAALLALALVPIGILLYRERLSATNVVGLLLCAAGLVLAFRP
jgi:uncharacterized membrane protein